MRSPRVAAAALAAMVALLSTGLAPAQLGIGQVNGTVFGPDRKGAPGLPVAVVPQDGRYLYGTSTDSDGRYALKGMPPGTYSVMVGLPSGVVRKDGIRIRPLFRSIVDFTLGSDTPESTLPGLHASTAAAAPSPPSPGGGGVLASLTGDGAATAASSPAAGSPTGGGVAPGGLEGPPAAPAAAPSGASAGAAPAGTASPGPAGVKPEAGPGPAVPAAASPGTAAAPAATSAAIPGAPPTASSDPAAAATPASGIAMTWTLLGPEKTSAPDAWVAAIPVKGAGALRRSRTNAEGGAELAQVPAGQYHLLVRAPGFMTWRLGPLPLDGSGKIDVMMTLVPYPMGFPGTLEDLLIPADPIPLSAEPKRP